MLCETVWIAPLLKSRCLHGKLYQLVPGIGTRVFSVNCSSAALIINWRLSAASLFSSSHCRANNAEHKSPFKLDDWSPGNESHPGVDCVIVHYRYLAMWRNFLLRAIMQKNILQDTSGPSTGGGTNKGRSKLVTTLSSNISRHIFCVFRCCFVCRRTLRILFPSSRVSSRFGGGSNPRSGWRRMRQ